MSLITVIAGIPLYTTTQEASDWARANGLSGHHNHIFQGRVGYMGGNDHAEAAGVRARVPGNGAGETHPCKDPLWMNLLPGTPSNLQKIDYCNRCAAMPGTNGNPVLGNFPVSITGGFWYHWQGGTNYCNCCHGVIESVPPTTTTTQTRGGNGGGGY